MIVHRSFNISFSLLSIIVELTSCFSKQMIYLLCLSKYYFLLIVFFFFPTRLFYVNIMLYGFRWHHIMYYRLARQDVRLICFLHIGAIDHTEELFFAKIKINDHMTVESLLQEGINPNCVDQTGNTPLHIAASGGHINVVSVLLKHKADVHIANNAGMTTVMSAAANGYATALRLLLESVDYDVGLLNTKDGHGSTPLMCAATDGHIAVLEILLKCEGLLLDECDSSGRTALHSAVLFGQPDAFEMLLHAGADPILADHHQTTPLMSAAIRSRTRMVQALVNSGNVNAVNLENFTALHMAVRMNSLTIAQALISAGAELDVYDHRQLTPVMWAVQYGRQELAELLLEAGCDPTCKDSRGRNVLHHAAFFGWLNVVDHLLSTDVDPNIESSSGNTALILAVRNAHFRIVKLFLDYNVNLQVPARLKHQCNSIPVLAIERQRNDICELLYKAGCRLTAQDVNTFLGKYDPTDSQGVSGRRWLHRIMNTPLSLQDKCRIVIRNSMGCPLQNLVKHLLVPSSIQKFLLLDEISCEDPLERIMVE